MQKQSWTDTERVSTGIAGLDALLDGGFLRARSYLLSGDAGTGKTTACMQFLLNGLQNGEKAVYVTVDERPQEILEAAAALDWDLATFVQDKSLVILDASGYFSARGSASTENAVDVQKIVSDLASYTKLMSAARLAIDPITPLILSADSQAQVQQQGRMLIHLLQSKLGTTNLLTAHLKSQQQDDLTGIEFLAAGVIVLRVDRLAGQFVRKISIKKMRGTAIEPSESLFKIAKGTGFVVSSEKIQSSGTLEESLEPLEVFQLPKEQNEKN